MIMAPRSSRYSPACMPSKAFARWKEYLSWQFCLAVLLSLILHAVAFDGLDFFHLPDTEPVSDTIQARIVTPPPKPQKQSTINPAKKIDRPEPAIPQSEIVQPPVPVSEAVVPGAKVIEPVPEPVKETVT